MTALINISIEPAPIALPPLPTDGTSGAECIFRGQTRADQHSDYGTLIALEYEAYEPMASELLKALAMEITKEFEITSLRIVHATGRVPLGEPSVLIETRAAHRAPAFEATSATIDRLKKRLPIFKTEHWEHGTTRPQGVTPTPSLDCSS